MARLEAMRWYGFSNSRPISSGMPGTSAYSQSWRQSGGLPYAWYRAGRPTVIYSNGSGVYR
jgi:hypothetical protein